jgi:hypothetical protein
MHDRHFIPEQLKSSFEAAYSYLKYFIYISNK